MMIRRINADAERGDVMLIAKTEAEQIVDGFAGNFPAPS